jgi:uncharacterized small protein (DUF1192 family)
MLSERRKEEIAFGWRWMSVAELRKAILELFSEIERLEQEARKP